MSSAQLVEAIGRTANRLPQESRRTLVRLLRAGATPDAVRGAVPTPQYQELVDLLLQAIDRSGATGEAVALAMECAAARDAEAQRVSLVWTGPTTSEVAVRRTDQALLQVIDRSQERLIVVSFAVYKVTAVATALRRAADRGVRVDLVLESESASEGKVAYEMWDALGAEVVARCGVYTWPSERRPTTPGGSKASLHAKCAVSDGRSLLVSSANLTEFAHWYNMELGLLVEKGKTPGRVQRHFEALIAAGELVAVAGE